MKMENVTEPNLLQRNRTVTELLCFVFPRVLVDFLQLLYKAYCDLYFTYLEINPLGESQSQLPHS